MNSIIKVEYDRALHCFHFEAPKIRRVSSSHTSAVVVLIDNIVSYFCSPKRTLSGINVHKTLIGNTKEHTSGYAMLFLEVHQEITLSTWDKNSFNPTLLDFISDQIAFCVNFSFFFPFFFAPDLAECSVWRQTWRLHLRSFSGERVSSLGRISPVWHILPEA